MPNNTILIKNLETRILKHYDSFMFCLDTTFYWSASQQKIHYQPAKNIEELWQLLHEIAHAELDHHNYTKDILLLRQETAAWHYAKTYIAPLFDIEIDEVFAEDQLDSYRNWLHSRSRCPECMQTGIQQTTSTYQCVNCLCSWFVNDARQRRLRRVKLQGQNRFDRLASAEPE